MFRVSDRKNRKNGLSPPGVALNPNGRIFAGSTCEGVLVKGLNSCGCSTESLYVLNPRSTYQLQLAAAGQKFLNTKKQTNTQAFF